jgi:hypothetical protein
MSRMLIKDVQLAAYLIANNLRYELEPAEHGRADFSFENDERLRETLQRFNAGATIEANKYSDTIRLVKSILYSYKQST